VTLTLEAGVEVRLDPSRRLRVYGELSAVGTPGQKILFTRNAGGAWNSINALGDGSATLEHCEMDGATFAIYANGTGAIDLVSSTLRDCTYGIYASNQADLTLTDCQVRDNTNGIDINGGSLALETTVFSGNSTVGVTAQGLAPVFSGGGCSFDGNGVGLSIQDVAGLSLTTPVAFSGNTDTGLELDGCDAPTVDNLSFTGNTGGDGAMVFTDCGDVTLGAGNVIGGPGLENSWPVTIGAGAYLTAASVVPASGNTRDAIQVIGTPSDRSGTWRLFPGLNYEVNANPTFQAGSVLTIEPGVTVRLASNRRLNMRGTLLAQGAPGQEITFMPDDTSWNYLYFQDGGGGTLQHCVIDGASYGVYLTGSGTVDLTDSEVRNCGSGVSTNSDDCSPNLTDTTIHQNGNGVDASRGTITFLRSRIIDNDNYGVDMRGATAVFGSSLAEWNDIHGNGGGADGRDLRTDENDVTAAWVYWGTMDHAQILTQIWDFHDDRDRGYVQILPFVNAAHDDQATAVDDGPEALPSVFAFHGNAPNPFNPATEIRFELPRAERVRLHVYDLSGALVATLVDGHLPAGEHAVPWRGVDDRGRAAPSGVYLTRLIHGGETLTRSMMLVR